jgi:hypothetical protein
MGNQIEDIEFEVGHIVRSIYSLKEEICDCSVEAKKQLVVILSDAAKTLIPLRELKKVDEEFFQHIIKYIESTM